VSKYESRIEELEKQCAKLEKTLGTFIGWCAKDLGHDNVIRLLDMMSREDIGRSKSE